MDAKYLEEIKFREQVAQCGEIGAVSDSQHDIPALIAEVEQDEKLIESYKESGLEQATESYELDKENATLKKALELMARNACDETEKPMSDWDMVGCPPHAGPDACNGGNNGRCHECWIKYFTEQAQQLTHETHGESEEKK